MIEHKKEYHYRLIISSETFRMILVLCDADADGKPDLGLTSKDRKAMERGFNPGL